MLLLAPNQMMYDFTDDNDYDGVMDYMENERWQERIEEGRLTPREVNPIRVYMRLAFHPFTLCFALIFVFLLWVIYLCVLDRR
jgi:hypothetical protein